MKPTFVFFHVGCDAETPRMLVESIRRANPDAEIIQCTDVSTDAIPGVTNLQRFDGNAENLMIFRLSAFARLNLRHPAIYMDTDMLVLSRLDPAALLSNESVLLCERTFDRNLPHSGKQRGVEFPEHRGRALGEVYPYLACFTVTRTADFWHQLLAIIESLDPRFHRWYGDQEAMRIWVDRASESSRSFLFESEFACLPERTEHLDSARVLHFKGSSRKSLMTAFAEKIQRAHESVIDASHACSLRTDFANNSNVRYVIMTPPPNPKSAGITYLNSLAGYLRSIGKQVLQLFAIYSQEQLHIWGDSEIPSQNHWVQPWPGKWVKVAPGDLAKILSDRPTILIHGENQHHKWFDGLNVVRYYLHKIGGLQKKGVPRDGEFKLSWHPMFCEDADFCLRKSMVRADLAAAEKLSLAGRSLDLSYVGKAWIHSKQVGRLANTIELTRDWPNNDDEYFYLLSKSRLLFTFDAATSVLDDAIIMGALPVIMSTQPFSRQEWEANLEPEMQGCYCFIDEDYDHALKIFIRKRSDFIAAAKIRNDDYFINLKKFCELAEGRFYKTLT
jgi:hypothetical protein